MPKKKDASLKISWEICSNYFLNCGYIPSIQDTGYLLFFRYYMIKQKVF
jgi:hypothetical protein